MSEHEPECWIVSHSNPLNGCICTELRACEQRVNSSNLTMWNRTQEQAQQIINAGLGIAWKDGFKEGLNAAREAVAAMVIETVGNSAATVDQALAAIDALRGES